MPVLAPRRLFTVEEYYAMSRSQILSGNIRVELIEGEMRQMTPIGIRHASCVMWLNHFFSQNLKERAIVNTQNPLRLSEHSEVQPDLTLLSFRSDFYRDRHPTPADVFLVIEAADSSLEYDRTEKIPLYARHAISEVWLVDLEKQIVESYLEPAFQGYQNSRIWHVGETIIPHFFPDIVVDVKDIFGL